MFVDRPDQEKLRLSVKPPCRRQRLVFFLIQTPKCFKQNNDWKDKSLTLQRGHAAAEGQSSQDEQWFGHGLDGMLLQQAESESDERSGEPTEPSPALWRGKRRKCDCKTPLIFFFFVLFFRSLYFHLQKFCGLAYVSRWLLADRHRIVQVKWRGWHIWVCFSYCSLDTHHFFICQLYWVYALWQAKDFPVFQFTPTYYNISLFCSYIYLFICHCLLEETQPDPPDPELRNKQAMI